MFHVGACLTLALSEASTVHPYQLGMMFVNPRQACAARVTIVVLSVCLSVTTLAATDFVLTLKLRYV